MSQPEASGDKTAPCGSRGFLEKRRRHALSTSLTLIAPQEPQRAVAFILKFGDSLQSWLHTIEYNSSLGAVTRGHINLHGGLYCLFFFFFFLLRWLIFTPGGKSLLTGICMIISMSTCAMLWKEFCCTPTPFSRLLQELSLLRFPALIGLSILSRSFCPLCGRESIQGKKIILFCTPTLPGFSKNIGKNMFFLAFKSGQGGLKEPLPVLKALPRFSSFRSGIKAGVKI